jgi:dihydropteroate synthase
MGVNNLLIDPGFGFGKSLEHNYILLSKLNYFSALRLPLVVGISRKSMVNRVLGTSPRNALNGTTVLNTLALLNGANILRVHDVRAAREAIQLVGYYQSQ